MKAVRTAAAVFVIASVLAGNVLADSTSIEFYDPAGATITGKVGWRGDAATGEMFVETPNDGNGVTIKEGTVTANGFVGDGSGLTDLPAPTVDWTDIQNRPTGLDDGDQAGITSESDPTVPATLKDGVGWTEVTGKPSTYPASSHDHQTSDITDFPTSFPPSAHSHAWGDVTGKPTSFPPESHSHSVANVTGLQTELDSKADESGATFTGNVNMNGGAKMGSSGMTVSEMRVLTGSLGTSGTTNALTTISYPSGYTKDNTYVVSAMVQHSTGSWYLAGDLYEGESVRTSETGIQIVVQNASFGGNAYKVVIMR